MAGKKNTEVRIGAPAQVGGYGRVAPIGTARPTDAKTALLPAYTDFGYISDDGIEVTTENGVETIKDWNLDDVAWTQKSNECSLKFRVLQLNAETAKMQFGAANVTLTGTAPNQTVTKVRYTGEMLKAQQWAFLMEDLNGPMILDIADGTCTGMQGFKLKKNVVIGFDIELKLRKDPTTNSFFDLHLTAPAA